MFIDVCLLISPDGDAEERDGELKKDEEEQAYIN